MSIKRTLLKNTSLNLFGYFFLAVASLISIPILLKSLGTTAFGLYLLLDSSVPLASVFDLGLSTAAIRYLSLPDITKADKNKIWRTSFWLFILTGIVTAIVAFFLLLLMKNLTIFSGFNLYYFALIALVLAATIFVDRISAHLLVLPQSEQSFGVFNIRNIAVGSGNTIFTAILALIFPNLLAIFSLQFFFYFATALYLLWYSQKFFDGQSIRPQSDREVSKKLLNFGIKNFVGKVASQAEAQMGKYILGGNLSAAAIAIFAIPQSLVIKAAGAISQLPLALFPLSTSLISKERIIKLRRLIFSLQGLIFLIGIISIIVVNRYGETLLSLWLRNPEIVKQSYPILKIMIWYFALTILTPIPTTVLDSINQPQIPSFFAVFTTIIELILMLIYVPRLGVFGAAQATVAASAVSVSLFVVVFVIAFERYKNKLLSPDPPATMTDESIHS